MGAVVVAREVGLVSWLCMLGYLEGFEESFIVI
jgi:hypothetical protein